MPLAPSTRLGPYEILGPLGAGGMGEVYKARDTRLDRIVAVKVLPPHVLSDPALRARFELEARTVSSLDHPNICIVHDVGREGDVQFIVMQYLEGETLAARLARGPLPLDEALRYAIEIAAALDKAHRAGILHRDLKPGNVMLSKSAGRDATARLLDFGLAKVTGPRGIATLETVQATAAAPLTERGTILGTLLYMSPEQLEGREVDARSDIFSFGALLYEMVTGRRAFDGTSQATIIGAILEREPPPIASLAPLTPPALDRVVRKCLAKDRDRRWQSAADLGDELSWIAQSSGIQPQPAAPPFPSMAGGRSRFGWTVAVAALVALAATLGWALLQKRPLPETFARHVSISLPEDLHLTRGGIAISPDGRTIVFVASPSAAAAASGSAEAVRRLYVRRFDSPDVIAIAGTERARAPFFSPDGQSVGYFTARGLMKVALRGGPPARVGGTPPVTHGGVWLTDGSIVVAPTQSSGLVRFSPEGVIETLTTPDEKQVERAHLWPRPLPGGRLLFTIRRGTVSDVNSSDVAILDLATRKHRVLMKDGAFAQYSPTGHLLFVRGDTLSAVVFDPKTQQITGAALPVMSGLAVHASVGGAHYAVASDGSLLFLRGVFAQDKTSAVWVDRTGSAVQAEGIAGNNPGQPRISPDGSRALYDSASPAGDDEVFVADLARRTTMRVSQDPADDFNAVWTPDSHHAIWTALPPARMPFLQIRPVDGTGQAEPLLGAPAPGGAPDDGGRFAGSQAQFAGSVSPSGVLAYTQASATGTSDIWAVAISGDRKARPVIVSPAWEFGPEFSPDGKWIAYVSDESGARDIYVVPYPGPGAKRRVTSNGGVSPAWSRDGRELFYQSGDAFMVVDIKAGQSLDFGAPRILFRGNFVIDSREDGPRAYDVMPSGQQFLMLVSKPSTVPPPDFQVLLNWADGLKNDPANRR